ncbi:hypothetical protein [Fundicoccus culcitae]|uniref:Uncharacterized protein n=1 Tax=Fundicoccus culcitae TaxID=2969821 RepID=A0ABY5P4G4_9LACT|nr:hypothetical protein [Fundicoccus culcitae]UUX33589.1 hypothetical protein NRE15_11880 [Fundicoccus culcitae]
MNVELNGLVTYLNDLEVNLEELKTSAVNDPQSLKLIHRFIEKENFTYKQKLEEQMTESRSPQAREMARVHLLYFQSIDNIIKSTDTENRSEMAYLYSEFSQEFINHIIYQAVCYYLDNQD